jgi:hypothetical protein
VAILRQIRVQLQGLRAVLASVRSGETDLGQYSGYVANTRDHLQQLVDSLASGATDDTTSRIGELWRRACTVPLLAEPQTLPAEVQRQLQLISQLDSLWQEMIFWIGYATVPSRLVEWLDKAEPGDVIPFHTVFQDEIEDEADRARIFSFIAHAPEVLAVHGGIADLQNGMVLRYSPRFADQLKSLGWIALVIGLASLACVSIAFVPPLSQPAAALPLIVGWLAALLGGLLHLGIDMARQAQTLGSGFGLPVGRLLPLLNARQGLILLRIGLLLVGYLALVYAGGTPDANATFLFNALLVGYSLDSAINLLGTRLDQASARRASLPPAT